ncbi:MAG TPA: hypothetical protein VK706_16020 [Candidatus Sulfotelmatobacter sp.]|jgi:hypothetical protein|nr:hypothetical protein [Candidatus Sulfotelmatobacter sp.]
MEFTSDSAKQFLLSKLTEQAMHDGVVLDEIEKRMFLFSESSGSPDFEAQEKFDKDYESKAYESKVTKLLRRSYARDKRAEDEKASWKAALKALSKEDFYGLVMVDQAKIPRVDAGLRMFLFGMLPFALVELAVVGTGFIVVFQPSAVRLHLPDWFRLLLLPVFFWLFWYVGKVFERIQLAKSIQRNESEQR